MDYRSTSNVIDKDINNLETNYAKGKVYIQGIIKEQESFIKASNKRIASINAELENIRKILTPYTDGDNGVDDNFRKKKARYSKLLVDRQNLVVAVEVAEESIMESKLLSFE